MFLGLTFEKLVLIGVLAAFVLGPERLPKAAQWLARATKTVRDYAKTARERLREEMGDDYDEVDWRKLDPRQYDPRRIIREALIDDAPVASGPSIVSDDFRGNSPSFTLAEGEIPPFDAEAT